jgi:hypothetical protein
MSDFYDNLLKATNNINDITTEKYATVTKANNNQYSVIEDDTNLEHSNIPSLNGAILELGDKVVVGFVDNSIYNPIILGTIGKEKNIDTDLDISLEMDLLENGYLKIVAELVKGV